VLLVAIPAIYAVSTAYWPVLVESGLVPGKVGSTIKRQNWPQREIAAGMAEIWKSKTGRPLTLIAGEATNWIGGLIAITSNPMPRVFTDADPSKSPWVSPSDIDREGALVVWQAAGSVPPPRLAALIGDRPRSVVRFALPRFPDAQPVSIGYAIIAPKDARAAPLTP